MKSVTRRQVAQAAWEGEGFCMRCSAQQSVAEEDGQVLPCEVCGALAVLPAEHIQMVLDFVEEEG